MTRLYRALVPVLIVLMLVMNVAPAAFVYAEDPPPSPSSEESTSEGDEESTSEPAPEPEADAPSDDAKEDTEEEDTTAEPSPENIDSTDPTTEATAEEEATTEEAAPPAAESQELSEENQETPEGEGADGEDGAPNEPGEDGGAGEAAEEPAPSDGEPAVIETGNASATSQGSGIANTTEVNTDTATTTPQGEGGGGGDVTIDAENTLAATSTASSTAETGENLGVDPDAVYIETGDADAFGYLISLFNVVVTNSSGSILFLRNPLNSMLDLTQRIIDAFRDLTGGNGSCSFLGCSLTDATFNIFGNNVGEVTNTLRVGAGTGSNTGVSDEGVVGIKTGDANAFGGIVTFGNLQIVDSRYLVILLNNAGDLNGNIVLPEPSFFNELSAGGARLGRGSNLNATNTVEIENHGTSTATSGGNTTSSEEGGYIESGDADAKTSVINFANQIGAPLCFIVAVGGSWNGDIYQLPEGFSSETTEFGQLICGAGGGEARSARSDLNIDTTNYAKVLNQAFVEATTGDNSAYGLGAAIKTGDAKAYLQILNVLNQNIIGQDWIFALFTITGDWNGDLTFGVRPGETDPGTILAGELLKKQRGKKIGGLYEQPPQIVMHKTVSVSTTTVPAVVNYTITISNTGEGKLFLGTVTDTLTNPAGTVVHKKTWELGTIYAGEDVVVKYSMEFGADSPAGRYTNSAELSGSAFSPYPKKARAILPIKKSSVIDVVSSNVLGASTCPAYLNSYIRPFGRNNAHEVRLLEEFLRDSEGESVVPDGTYDSTSVEAVKRFQERHRGEVLAPWGIESATGYVYYTTQKKINDLYCAGMDQFALSKAQMAEITRYRNFRFGQGPVLPMVAEMIEESEADYAFSGSLAEAVEAEAEPLDVEQAEPKMVLLPPRNTAFSFPFFDSLFSWLRSYAQIPIVEAAQ